MRGSQELRGGGELFTARQGFGRPMDVAFDPEQPSVGCAGLGACLLAVTFVLPRMRCTDAAGRSSTFNAGWCWWWLMLCLVPLLLLPLGAVRSRPHGTLCMEGGGAARQQTRSRR